MSSALAIASVTAVLKNLLENGLTARSVSASIGGEIVVSALPPDRIPIGGDERAQLNLFLYQITPNTGLHRTQRADGTSLALDLHYLITAYGASDFQIEILLAMPCTCYGRTRSWNAIWFSRPWHRCPRLRVAA